MSQIEPQLTTHIAVSDATTVTVRGKDLVKEIIGSYSFTDATYLMLTGNEPDEKSRAILDACLITLMEHGLTPSAVITRLLADGVPEEMQVAVAGGLLGVGSVFAGTMEGCALLLAEAFEHDGSHEDYLRQIVREHRAAKKPVPGFGHPYHKPDDPRSYRLLEVADGFDLPGHYIKLLRLMSEVIDTEYGKHITINATGAIAALLLEIGVPAVASRGVAVISRSAGLVGHVLEEKEIGIGRHITGLVKKGVKYQDPPGQ